MNGRAYDPDLGRFMSVDPFVAMPENGQSLNPYSYVMNNPLKYTDPSGYVPISSSQRCQADPNCGDLLAGSSNEDDDSENDGNGATNGASSSNTASTNSTTSDSDVDLAMAAINEGMAAIEAIGSHSSFGYIEIPLQQFNSIIAPIKGSPAFGWLKYVASTLSGGIFYGNSSSILAFRPDPQSSADIDAYLAGAGLEEYAVMLISPGSKIKGSSQLLSSLPNQMHHFATNKSKTFTPALKKIADKYNLKLDDMWNKELLPHRGRHPNAYHQFVLDGMRLAHRQARGNVNDFLSAFEEYIIEPVRKNPELLRKSGWK